MLHTSMVDKRRGVLVSLPLVYMHSALYEIYAVQWCCIEVLLISGGGLGTVCHGYMCILQ